MEMQLSRRNVIVFVMTIILLLIIQLIRFDMFLDLNALENTPAFEYRRDETADLVPADRDTFRKKSCLVIHTEDQREELANIEAVLTIMQFQQDTMKPGDQREQPFDYDLIIIIDQDSGQLADIEQIVRYTREGGHLLYLGNGYESPGSVLHEYAAFFGIEKWGIVAAAGSVDFQTELLSGLTGITTLSGANGTLDDMLNPRLVSLSDGCFVHASDLEGHPIIWESREDGNIMVFNTGSIGDKRMRGLMAGAISVFMGSVIYPVTQSAVYQIVNLPLDDQIETEFLLQRYNRHFSQFIQDIWWPDMVHLMRRHKLKYSVAFCGLYDNSMIGTYTASEASADNFSNLSKTILRHDGEIIYQGRNWQETPCLDDPAIEMMEDTIRSSAALLRKKMPNYDIRAFTHASSRLDGQTEETIKAVFPDLAVISTSCFYQPDDGGSILSDSFFDEFAVSANGMVAFPHMTAGYLLDDFIRFQIASAVTLQGLVSHAIMADEIMITASDLSWEDMYRQYAALFAGINEMYPWLSNDTISTAAAKLDQALHLDLYYSINDQVIKLVAGGFSHHATLILVTGHEVIGSEGCDYERIDSIRYLVTLHEKTATLEVRP